MDYWVTHLRIPNRIGLKYFEKIYLLFPAKKNSNYCLSLFFTLICLTAFPQKQVPIAFLQTMDSDLSWKPRLTDRLDGICFAEDSAGERDLRWKVRLTSSEVRIGNAAVPNSSGFQQVLGTFRAFISRKSWFVGISFQHQRDLYKSNRWKVTLESANTDWRALFQA